MPEKRPLEHERADLAEERLLELGLDPAAHCLGDGLDGLEDDVSDEAVGDGDVDPASADVVALDVADEVEVAELLDERERLVHELVALALLRSDRHEADRRLLAPQHRLGVDVAHDRPLRQPLGMAIHVRPRIQQQERTPRRRRRQDHRERRTLDAVDAAKGEDGARRDRAGVARRDEHVRALLLDEAHRDVDRAVLLLADRLDRLVAHLHLFRRVDNLQAGVVEGLAFQLLLQDLLVACEEDVQVRVGGQGGQGPFHGGLRAVVAAETVYEDLDHTSFFT